MLDLSGSIGIVAQAGSVGSCCRQLAAALPNKIFYPGNATYSTMQSHYWGLQEAVLSPSCIVVPQSAQDVSVAVSVLTQNDECPFAVKGGGHSSNAGYANIQDGITIDMNQLDSVSLNSDNSMASIGAGATWLPVYEYLDAVGGIAVAGGQNGNVGVGGLLIGGGMAYFSPRVGWACDNVVNFEIVLASGETVNANSTSSPDLFKALKGGSSNFGIVTRYDLATFPQGGIWGGTVSQDISSRQQVFEAFASIADGPEYDPYTSIVTELVFSGGEWSIEHLMTYTKEVDTPPPVYQPLLAIQPQTQNTLRNTNLSTLANEGAPPPTFNIALSTGTYGVDIDLMNEIFDINNATVHELLPQLNGTLAWGIAYEPLPAIWMQYGDLKGGNSLGTNPGDGNAFILLITARWTDTSANDVVQEAASKMQRQVDNYAASKGLKHEFVYLNYADASQDPLASYGRANLNFLREVARKYDPKGVFQTQMPGGFKVSKAQG